MQVKFYYCEGVKPLQYQTDGASGLDLTANESRIIFGKTTDVIDTGVYVIIPKNYEGQVRARSGLASKGVFVANSPGTLDSDYRGEIKVIIYNSADIPFNINKGDRIAQLVFMPVVRPEIVVFDNFNEWNKESITVRGSNGLGSTGV